MMTTDSMAQPTMQMRPRTCVGDGVPANSPALLLHDCFREYRELQKTYRWWNRKTHALALRSYNRALQRLDSALAKTTITSGQ